MTLSASEFYCPIPEVNPEELQFDFPSSVDAQAYIRDKVDVPAPEHEATIDDRFTLRVYAEHLVGGRFTNVYDFSSACQDVAPKIHVDDPKSVEDFLTGFSESIAGVSGGFLYLADKGSGVPRQSALNLALKEAGVLCSVPVVDRETLIADSNGLSVRHLRAFGELTINGRLLTWSGSRTSYQADCKLFGNGNIVIRHDDNEEPDGRKKRIRVLDESSRYTPSLDKDSALVDVGLIAGSRGRFRAAQCSQSGSVDLFGYDAVMRCEGRYMHRGTDSDIQFHSVDSFPIDGRAQGAISVGPLLSDVNFERNPINTDPSLGSDPPLVELPVVRLVVYVSAANVLHLRLFDGRPESEYFRGVTPQEAVSIIAREEDIAWGCFLDSGRTAKLAAKVEGRIVNYGNAHYLRWPAVPGGRYIWVPGAGRPVPSAITLS